MQRSNYALIGIGYVAERHLRAIKETGGELVCALDIKDSVGILDSYFPDCVFFTEFELFDQFIFHHEIDYLVVCSPNYLHDSHIRYGLRMGMNVICEKPLILNTDFDSLLELEKETGKKVFTILQLRLHPAIKELKESINGGHHQISLTYITSRGNWYHQSWKGDKKKSGGIATNIGIHFFDMLVWIFGKPIGVYPFYQDDEYASGELMLQHSKVYWKISTDYKRLPEEIKKQGKRTYRSLTMNDKEIEFSEGFTDLHTKSYEAIHAGQGFGILDAKDAIEICAQI